MEYLNHCTITRVQTHWLGNQNHLIDLKDTKYTILCIIYNLYQMLRRMQKIKTKLWHSLFNLEYTLFNP